MSTTPASIIVDVYRARDGFRWRIKAASRGRRIISESSEAYARVRGALRGLVLTTGGEYTELKRSQDEAGHHFEGVIVRGLPGGVTEEISVAYIGATPATTEENPDD